MINILIPTMGDSLFFKDNFYPKPMIEILGKTMLEKVVDNYKDINDRRYIFIFSQKECNKFYLDDSARILAKPKVETLILENMTEGALCSCLMAIKLINNDEPLIIANCDQIIDITYTEVLEKFNKNKVDIGVITFESVHPRWSYIKVERDEVIEVAEKRPLSKQAIAGFYYFKRGKDFIEAAKKVIIKDEKYSNKFYISSTINQAILLGKKIGYFSIEKEKYHSFYSPHKIKEYEDYIRGKNENK